MQKRKLARRSDSLADRLMLWVERIPESTCWYWGGGLDKDGYGNIAVPQPQGRPKTKRVHRVAYEEFVGPLPNDSVIDHKCREHSCINPDHLEPVTAEENMRRGLHGILRTHCKQGHAMTAENTYMAGTRRTCKKCRYQWFTNWKKSQAA